jgi:NADH:ubiquinone oxidoreductase subunit 4 (subunit M)
MIVAAIYLLYMVGRMVFGQLVEPHGHGRGHASGVRGHGANHEGQGALPPDLNAREIGILMMLAIPCVVLGLYPAPMLDALEAPVNQMVRTVMAENGVEVAGVSGQGAGVGEEPIDGARVGAVSGEGREPR